ncbi:MAG: MOSC domain-containing protein [Immundisolibacteraceae bacterium]|nr:MOSC domain-containing protein [Immundisolibacteraceae bacterium]
MRFPVKSLRGLAVPDLEISAAGLTADRRWMVVDGKGHFLTQRQLPRMATLSVIEEAEGLLLGSGGSEGFERVCMVEKPADSDVKIEVTVWSDKCQGLLAKQSVNQWLSHELEHSCRLVYLPLTSPRAVRGFDNNHLAFADGYPLLLTSQASLRELNLRLASKGVSAVSMNRFRPNLVVGADQDLEPFAEDHWASLTVGNLRLVNAKACGRCMVITTDQRSGIRDAAREPLSTLREFRIDSQGEICFGINLVPELLDGATAAVIKPDDQLEVQWK